MAELTKPKRSLRIRSSVPALTRIGTGPTTSGRPLLPSAPLPEDDRDEYRSTGLWYSINRLCGLSRGNGSESSRPQAFYVSRSVASRRIRRDNAPTLG